VCCYGAQGSEDPVLHSYVLRGIDFTLRHEYGHADSVFRIVEREFPDHPAGSLYRAAVIQSKILDLKLEMNDHQFDSLRMVGQERAERWIQLEPRSAWGHFYLGTALGYESYARVYREEWFGGITKAMSSVDEFRRAIELDSSLHDACVGIGTYYYWKGRKTEFLNWLPFVGDDRKNGIALIQRTAERGIYNRFTAMSVLATIYIDAGEYESAERLADLGLQSYPRNRVFLWEHAAALEKQGRHREAVNTYERLLDVIQKDGEEHRYNELVCRLNMARAFAAMADSSLAQGEISAVLSLQEATFPPHLRKRAADKFREARALERSLATGTSPDK